MPIISNAFLVLAKECVQERQTCSVGRRPTGVKVRSPLAWVVSVEKTKRMKPTDKAILGMVSKAPGRNGSEGTQLFRNSSGNDWRRGRLIKTLGNLQDLRHRIYRKRKAEAAGWCGVDAGDLTGLKAPPIGCVS